MSNKIPKLMIIDGNALIHRSFHALPPTMRTKTGELTNAVYGFTTVLLKAIREMRPEYVVLTLDRSAPTFRHLDYKDYKGTRVKAPDELYEQIPRVKEVASSFGIPIYEKDGLEADDLIGIIANRTDHKINKIILTGDLDTLQLINDHTQVYTMSRGLSDSILYDKKMVEERFGLVPGQMIDYKALRGDPSDNIPGVRGIGEKIATELLKEFNTLDNIYKFIESGEEPEKKIKPRVIELLKQYKENAYLSQKLATIRLDDDLEFDLEQARFSNFDKEKIVNLFSELEFRSLLPRIKDLIGELSALIIPDTNEISDKSESTEDTPNKFNDKFERNNKLFKYILVDDEKKFNTFIKKLRSQKKFTFDTETTSFEPLESGLIGISFSWIKGEAHFVLVKSQKSKVKSNNEQQLSLFIVDSPMKPSAKIHPWLEKLRPIFENGKIKKFGHNIKFDIRVMRHHGVETDGIDFDTMIASYLLNPGTRQHNLDAVTFSESGFEKISKEDLLGKGREKITFSEVPIEKLSLYSCEDADFTGRLVAKLRKQLSENQLDKLFNEIEMPLVKILAGMEDLGIKIDAGYLKKIGKSTNSKIKRLEEKIWRKAGTNFNINSPLQLREILFEKLKISSQGIGKTKTGLSTASDELAKMKNEHLIIPLISEYRELSKLANTYIETLPKLILKSTGRLHTSFNQAVTATGRLSSTEPNLQNIPIRTELGREIRKAFIAEKGYSLVALDYSQIELRLAAHMSGDKKMIAAFKNGVDIHSATAAEINQIPLDKVTKQMRREAKATNFGILYGQGPHGLSQTADISYARAKEFIDGYFKVYSGVKEYIEKSIEQSREKGYAETLFGRRRYLPEINSSVLQIQKNAERMAINTPLQGTAADMIKVAMINVCDSLFLNNNDKNVRLLLQVHDELLFEVKTDLVPEIGLKIKEIMENIIKLKVPIVVDVSAGSNWGSLEKFKN